MIPVIVFDTNVLVSALLSLRGTPFRCVALAKAGLVQSVTCPEILEEFQEKLRGKFSYPRHRAQAAVEEVQKLSQVVTITNSLKVVAADPGDDKILECATVGGASHIVTGDRRHLLPLGSYQGISILSPMQFLTLVLAP